MLNTLASRPLITQGIAVQLLLCLQRVKAECIGKHAPDGIKVLPFDLIGPPEELQQAAADAVQAFPEASLDYLIHNAGSDSFGCT